jgi:DNA-binding response OmpR family regulator
MDSLESKKILIVEDEDRIRQVIKIIIRGNLVDVDEAADGKVALEKIKSSKYDMVILDLMIPEIDGMGVLQTIRSDETTKDIPVVIVSAKTRDSEILAGMKEGANFYITKPFEPQDLINIMEFILGVKY